MGPFFAVLFVIAFIVITIILIYKSIYNSRKEFVLNHSNKIKALIEINSRFNFVRVDKINYTNTYDNEKMFNDITTTNYLVYRLAHEQNNVNNAIRNCINNNNLYTKYKSAIDDIKVSNIFDVEVEGKDIDKYRSVENDCFHSLIKSPDLNFNIRVCLTLTNIQGSVKRTKKREYSIDEVEDLIIRINNKNGNYYNDKGIWESICRVERGKVSNKMRFAIYARDNYRCKICGKKDHGDNLEIDHIIPIAKGGKTTFDNLQTLCHDCNVKKGSTVKLPNNNKKLLCPKCGGTLKLINGKYGEFYGCSNYPKCRYTASK